MEGRKEKQVLTGGLVPLGGGVRKGCGRLNMMETVCIHVGHGKLSPVETILRMGDKGE
jgi:hypothetical protein